jgi:hypothetical protein
MKKPKSDKGYADPFRPMERCIVGGMEPMIKPKTRIDRRWEQPFFKTINHSKTLREGK